MKNRKDTMLYHGHHARGHPLHKIQDPAEWKEVGNVKSPHACRTPAAFPSSHNPLSVDCTPRLPSAAALLCISSLLLSLLFLFLVFVVLERNYGKLMEISISFYPLIYTCKGTKNQGNRQ